MRDALPVLGVTLACALALYFGGIAAGPYWQLVALNLAMWIALTQSWSLFSGLTGYVSLGHVVAYGLGAYTMVILFREWPVWVLIPLGLVGGGGGLLEADALLEAVEQRFLQGEGPHGLRVVHSLGISRKQIIGVTSSVRAHRPSGIPASIPSRNFSLRTVSVIGVSTTPKHTVLARMP